MLMTNRSNHEAYIHEFNIVLAPGDVIDVADGYCTPLRAPNGSRIKPIIERLCPCIEPADESLVESWKRDPVDVKPAPKRVTAASLINSGMPPGVARIIAAKASDESEAAKRKGK